MLKKSELLLLGAEARPCDLTEIHRVYDAWRDSIQRDANKSQPLGLIAIAMRWLRG